MSRTRPDRKFPRLVIAIGALALLPAAATADPIALQPGQKQLFIDDVLVEAMDGLERRLHQPTDHGANPVLLPNQPWEHRRIPFGSVYFDAETGKFRCWYLAMNIYDSRPGFRGYRKEHHVPIQEAACICYAESDDGVHWTKPDLGLHEFRGSSHNNIVLTCPGTHFDSTSVIHTPHDAEHPWKMISFIGLWPYKKELIEKQWPDTTFGIDRHGHYAWSSRDGIHWEAMNDGRPVLRAHDRSMFWWDTAAQRYAGSAKTSHEGKRAQQLAVSDDAIEWTTTPQFVHRADEGDHPGDEAEAAYGFNYGAQSVGFAEMRRIRRDQAVKINWELLTSRDGKRWSRPMRELFFADGPEDSWRHLVFKVFASPPIERDGELWIYYGGKTGLDDPYTGTGPNQAMCLAKLRVDGFVSLDAGDKDGTLVTRPLQLAGEKLLLNFDAGDSGQVEVEVLDELGRVLFSSPALGGDRLRNVVTWKNGDGYQTAIGQPVRLKIRLRNASLFSIWCE